MIDPQFWWYLARATGLVAWALLAATVVWGLLLRSGLLGRWLPWAWTRTVHRFLGVLSVLFTGLHLTGLLLDDYVRMSLRDLLVPLASSWRPVPVALGVVAGYLLLAVLTTSLLASRMSRRWWKRVHLTSYLLFWSATMHLTTAGTDAGNAALQILVAGVAILVVLLTAVRIAGSWRTPQAAEPVPTPVALGGAGTAVFRPLPVAEVRRETSDAVSVLFAVPPDLAAEFRFRPGQHVTLRARIDGAVTTRAYSVCSGITDGELRIAARHHPGGRMSTWLNTALRPGDVVDVAPPAGDFTTDLDGLAQRHVLGIAAGSGITPVISVLSSVLAAEPASHCTLVYGNRTAASTLFATRLAELGSRCPDRLHVVHLRSQEPARPPVLTGRIDREALRVLARTGALSRIDEAFVCGPDAMVTEVVDGLVDDLGMPASHVRTEVFSPTRGLPPTAAARSGTVRLRHRGAERTVSVAPGETVLDAGLRAGMDLPFDCRVGVCGTCRATMSWAPATDAATTVGTVLTCRTPPLPGATLDFDADLIVGASSDAGRRTARG